MLGLKCSTEVANSEVWQLGVEDGSDIHVMFLIASLFDQVMVSLV